MNNLLMKTALLSGAIALSACSDSDNKTTPTEKPTEKPMLFEVTLKNITQGQIFSPPVLVSHDQETMLWKMGMASSTALEYLAEGGDTSKVTALASIEQSDAKSMPVKPGEKTQWNVEVSKKQAMHISVATMLISTNDGFTGVTGYDLSSLAVNEEMHKLLAAYDAGTEANDEINLPSAGNEGFNANRTGDVDRVYMHAGVLTEAELSSSVLVAEHKFDNPVAKILIKRVQ